ncbi:MAG: glycosyltransferase family 4 protein [Ilumatobacteraceae bacterium]
MNAMTKNTSMTRTTPPTSDLPLRLAVLCPHFAPDTAPTGAVMTRIAAELAALGHEVHVITALPWYRDHAIEQGWKGRGWRRFVQREDTGWGSITRVNPFPGHNRANLVRRGLGFVGFGALAALAGLRGGRMDGVLVMSPPLTNGLVGWLMKVVHRGPLVFNIQDVFPDAAVDSGAITNPVVIAVARWLERFSYRRCDAVTVLSGDLRDNVVAKLRPSLARRVRVIPNFVLTDDIRPLGRMTAYRRELLIGTEPVVLYAGNVGFSQSLELLIEAARELPEVTFVINGDGSARAALGAAAAGLTNMRFTPYQALERLPEVLATGDVHVVALRAGLGRVSVPSKTYSILAAGRPVLAAMDLGTEVPRILAEVGAGVAVPPDDPGLFIAALRVMLADDAGRATMGANGRAWAERAASPAAIAEAYVELFREVAGGGRGASGGRAGRRRGKRENRR